MGRDVWTTAVVGGGVVGLATGAVLARTGHRVVVLERHGGPGRETSSRNSGVIHAGLYYPAGSLKAATCVEGRELLYARCEREGLPYRRTGKLIVATTAHECSALETIRARAADAGVTSLRLLDRQEVARREPRLHAVAALWSPESGVVDAHALVESYRKELLSHGGELVTRTEVAAFENVRDQRVRIVTRSDDGERFDLEVSSVVNATGLWADRTAAKAGLDVGDLRIHWCKGDYFVFQGRAPRPETALVYPVPQEAGLGIHLTVDLGGRCIAGPDATYVDREDYDVDNGKAREFAASIACYLPGIEPQHLAPDYSGIRPKLQGPGEGFRDFVCRRDGPFVHLLGIESPGLTASEALARRVTSLLSS